ncbi:MAG: TolC family protein [Burkholderiales bacterium]|nr:TolC family protein [Burkholderiales bacterium]
MSLSVVRFLLASLACAAVLPPAVPACAAEVPESARGLSFSEALALLQVRNRDVQLAQRGVEVAQADTLSARARPNPNLSINALSIHPRIGAGPGTDSNNSVDAIVQLSQTFERGSKRELRGETTRFAFEAARGDLADALRQGSVVLAGAYYDLLLAQERVRITEDTAALLAKTVGAAELRLKAGDIAPSDLSRIRVDQLRAENERRSAAADRDRARLALAYVIGLDAEAPYLFATDAWPAAGEVARMNAQAAVEARADVRAAALRVQAAEKARDLARALRSRDVTLAAQYESFPGQPANNTIGFGVSVPLFLNYNYEGEIRRGEVNLQAAYDALERTRALAVADVNRAWSDLASARERVQRYDAGLLKEAQRAADAAEFAYRNGALGVIDLLDARRIHAATRNDAAAARADLARALIAWQAATAPYTPSP